MKNTKSINEEYAIQVKNITKVYKLYKRNLDRLRDALNLTRRKLYIEYYALRDINFNVKKKVRL